jgi:hypothetical protein
MTAEATHRGLRLGDPTPEQLRLYDAVDVHGYLDDQPDESRFVGTFILGLYQTFDRTANHFHNVVLLVPQSLDKWAVDQMNATLKIIKSKQEKWPAAEKANFNRNLVSAVRNLEMGSRVFQISQPARWVAFGFGEATPAPEWVKNGLLP